MRNLKLLLLALMSALLIRKRQEAAADYSGTALKHVKAWHVVKIAVFVTFFTTVVYQIVLYFISK